MAAEVRRRRGRDRQDDRPERPSARNHRRDAAGRCGCRQTAELWKPLAARREHAQRARIVLAAGHRPAEARRVGRAGADRNERHRRRGSRRRTRPTAASAPTSSRCIEQLVGDIERSLFVLHGGGRLRAADRLRESRQPDARANRGAAQGAGDPDGARRAARTADPPDRHRDVRPRRWSAAASVCCWRFWATEFFIAHRRRQRFRAPEAIAIDGRVLLFTLVLAAVAALLAGLVPALQASRAAVREHLQEGGREGGSGGSRRTRSALIAAEMALAFVLLAGAGILRAHAVERCRTSTAASRPTASRSMTAEPAAGALRRAGRRAAASTRGCSTRVRALPGRGVGRDRDRRADAAAHQLRHLQHRRQADPPPGQQIEYPVEIVSPGFFETLQHHARRRARRSPTQDHADAPPVVVVNETLARSWPGPGRIRSAAAFAAAATELTGAVADGRRRDQGCAARRRRRERSGRSSISARCRARRGRRC